MRTALSIDRTPTGITDQPCIHCRRFDFRCKFVIGRERLLGFPVGNYLDAGKQAAAADITDVRMIAQRASQHVEQLAPHRNDIGQQILLIEAFLYRNRSSTSGRVPDVRMAVLEPSGQRSDCVRNVFSRERCRDRLIPATQAFGHRYDIRYDIVLLMREKTTRPSRATHDFVGNQQQVMLITNSPNLAKVAVHGCDRTQRCADNRLGDECRYLIRACLLDGILQFAGRANPVVFIRLPGILMPIGVTGADTRPVVENALIVRAARQVAGNRQRTERIAVVAELPADDDRFLGATERLPVLPCEFQRGFVGFGATRGKIDSRAGFGKSRCKPFRQCFLGRVREKCRVREGQVTDLLLNCGNHRLVPVAKARYGRAAAHIQILVTGLTVQVHALPASRKRIGRTQVTIKN